jgi:hypothetical protein
MTDSPRAANLLAQLDHLNAQQLRRLLVGHLTKQKLGLLFLTKDQSRLRVVNDDGSLGETVDWDDLIPVQEWLRASKPTVQ